MFGVLGARCEGLSFPFSVIRQITFRRSVSVTALRVRLAYVKEKGVFNALVFLLYLFKGDPCDANPPVVSI